ncbi:hypothetical protein BB560_000478 [Smittium megazygosporum]|uniref:ABC1 atypical kinase-like domain-containing protein n=1 Tax=Smittium megazygosporum TaxID=133381 RepID=A0A2T9ZK59_9FUNG|nr:hypothetical protein BB560_000478 [Smittium megazygosporum]
MNSSFQLPRVLSQKRLLHQFGNSKSLQAQYSILSQSSIPFNKFNTASFQNNATQIRLFSNINKPIKFTNISKNILAGKSKDKLEALHERNAKRLLYVCKTNGGLYIKFGQGIGLQGSVLPPQFSKNLSLLFDQAPTISERELLQVLKSEFPGMDINDLFLDFDFEPVASASIAQVHKARLRSDPNQAVAIKIQKPAIQKQLELDLTIFRLWCRLVEYRFGFPIMWSVPYTEKHFRMETDFIKEGKNSELALQVINTDKDLASNVYVPKVFWNLCSKQILVTEWIDGVSLINPRALEERGWSLSEIMNKIVSAFAQQLFISGHLHGDPHPGNILVRKNPDTKKNKPQVVIIDHGLYINESERFRKQYCNFWKAIFLQDTKETSKIAQSWGIKNSDFLSSMILFRPPDSHIKRMKKITQGRSNSPGLPDSNVKNNSSQNSDQQTEYDMQMSRKNLAIQFFSDSSLLPPELVFVMRNMNMIRSNNKALGSPVNRIKIMANYAALGSNIDNEIDFDTNTVYKLVSKHNSYPSNLSANNNNVVTSFFKLASFQIRNLVSYWHFKFSLFLIDSIFFYTTTVNRLFCWISGSEYSAKNNNFEVVLDKAMIASFEERFGYKLDPTLFDA